MIVSKIIYTKTDEAPLLATYSLLPIIKAFAKTANIKIETRDISLASRILCNFPENLSDTQKIKNDLDELGDLVKKASANIVKLPNISASIPQLKAAIAELQDQGYLIPSYPDNPKNDNDNIIRNKYSKILGSAVNPVLREGNSDRRVAKAVKKFAKNNPHSMGAWSKTSKTSVAHMQEGDFYSSEKSYTSNDSGTLKIELINSKGEHSVLRSNLKIQSNEIIDTASMNISKLREFFTKEIESSKQQNILLSLHLKATMMKVSDPIIFGHAVTTYYAECFEKYAEIFQEIGVDANNGIGDVYSKIKGLPDEQRLEIDKDLSSIYKKQPSLAMVDSNKGITNLHIPSNVIIDASMPAAIRSSGKMWGADGKLHDTKAMIPDRCYATIYQEVIDFCRENGAFDVTTMGNVSNIGLMAQKAEEYGSHDKTFEISTSGLVRVSDENESVLSEHVVKKGDIWRMCQTKDVPIVNWVKLAIERARITQSPAIFWLDKNRAHDRQLIKKVTKYLANEDVKKLDISILSPQKAMKKTLEIIHSGGDVISVTGNVLRDYLTDLFPILELGTSAKMLSIVPLLDGGGLYETGAGGSAPKHVAQFIQEGHLRWDSLGEFLAMKVSLEELARKTKNKKAEIIANALGQANSMFLENNKSPSRKVGEFDNRHSHFYLTIYWAKAIAEQSDDQDLKNIFSTLHATLITNEEKINQELNETQGKSIDLGGYYHPDEQLLNKAMRPSHCFNGIIDSINA
ncbi:MAG: isocitrate dehydrogenase [Woeseiaceae bacterium]|jgi:isocitrate dehydrogenase|tara:strand:+ start:24603 stop:26831 length:2229 start_codon:yes stop_codon:yes gene_type:complete